MEVQAFSAEFALPRLDEEDADGHGAEVEVVRVLAVVADLAQVSQVMFANCRLLFAFTRVRREWWRGFEVCWGGSCMAVGALGGGQGAAGREEGEAAYLVVWR